MVEVVAVIVRPAREEVDGDVDGYVDSRADGQGVFGDAEPVQDGLVGSHVTDARLGCLGDVVQNVDLEVVREELKVCRHAGIIAAAREGQHPGTVLGPTR
ncbi:hypothetical protein ACFCXF_12175 [Streptomyces virginiae]|uniref:hypothetical protein n=1 Tax=Streptomyces virginiae TaxID=1961 RepID=UPI0035D884D2